MEDLFIEYPSIKENNFQTLISSKKEFSDLRLQLKEAPPKKNKTYTYQPFKHQLSVQRYLIAYDELLLSHSPGTGKSCTVTGLTEYYKNHRSYIRHVYILVKGKSLKREIQNQIVCRCTSGDYLTENVRKSKGPAQRANVTRALNTWYTISTYKSFAFKIRRSYWVTDKDGLKKPNIEALTRDFSGCIFWIDEAHNLRVAPDVDLEYAEQDPESISETLEEKKAAQIREKEIVYQTLWYLLHAIKRSKKILTTATPMIDSPAEIGPLMNLILPYNINNPNDPDNLQFPRDFDYENGTLEDYQPYFQGRVSFLRSFDTGAIPRYIGDPLGEIEGDIYQTIVYALPMSDIQNAGYQKSLVYEYQRKTKTKTKKRGKEEIRRGKKEEVRRGKEEEIKSSRKEEEVTAGGKEEEIVTTGGKEEEVSRRGQSHGVYISERQATDMVYPDGSFGRDGFEKYVIKLGKDNYAATEELAPWLTTPETIYSLSCKYGDICSRLQLDNNQIPKTPGNFFIYGEYINGSGLIALTLCLEGIGYEKFNETKTIFLAAQGEEEKPFCLTTSEAFGERPTRGDFPKKPRYALLTKDTSDSKFAAIMETMNSYENRHGEYIKVLVSSPVGRDGINVNNVLSIEIVDSEWNPSATFQALSRGIRATSHNDLIDEIKASLVKKGLPSDNVTMDIDIHLHCAVDANGQSINLDMYEESEKKDRRIKKVERFIKQLSFDCWLNYRRNVRPADVAGSIQCDYQECEYKCWDSTLDPRLDKLLIDDRTTYDLLYADEYLDNLGKEIIRYFSEHFSSTLNDLYRNFPEHQHKYIDLAVDRLIRNKIPVLDRFGFIEYLREESGTVYLSKEYPMRNKERITEMYPLLEYSKNLITESFSTIRDLSSEVSKEEKEIAVKINVVDEKFDEKIDSLDIQTKVNLLEQALVNQATGKPTDFDDAITDKFKFYWFLLNVPEEKIQEKLSELTSKTVKQTVKTMKTGVRVKKLSSASMERMEEEETDTPEVYLHILWLLTEIQDKRSNYNVMPKFFKADTRYRLYQPGVDKEFRDASPYELIAYNEILQRRISESFEPLIEKGIFGSSIGGVFRIHNILAQKDIAITDNRSKMKGRTCETYDVADLIDFLWLVGVQPPKLGNFDNMSRAELMDSLSRKYKRKIDDFTTDRLKFYLQWYSGYKRKDYCKFLFDHFKKTGALFSLN